jgi:23S rRNA (cytosine1962-C5)-methyltransferase
MSFLENTKRVAVKLRAKAEKMVFKKHPWVFETSIEKIPADAQSGDLAIIYGRKSNKLIGLGLIDLESPIRIKMISFQPASINQSWFTEQLNTAFLKRINLLHQDVNGYRLLFGEADNLPGVICDVYDGRAVLKIYSTCWLPYIDLIKDALLEVVKPTCIILRMSRNLQRLNSNFSEGQIIYGKLDSEEVVFREHGVRFSANLIHGHKTGFFLDHRANRKKVGEMSLNKTVLDVFSYAGGFSVHALAGGASEVTSVDISKPALEAAKKNVSLNEFSGKHKTVAGDAFKVLSQFISERRRFDVVVIDPPSFAKQKSEVEKALQQYERLAELGMKLVAKSGVLVLASCSSRVTEEQFLEVCEETINGQNYELISSSAHDFDHPVINYFPEGQYLKCFYFKNLSS